MKDNLVTTKGTIGIGILIGIGSSLLLSFLSLIFIRNLASNDWIFILILSLLWTPLFSIVGALIGRTWKKTPLAIWIGAIFGAIIGIGSPYIEGFIIEHVDPINPLSIAVAFPLPVSPSIIIGALIGKNLKNTARATWIGAILGTVFGAILGQFLIWSTAGFLSG